MSAAAAGSVKPRASNTAKANKMLVNMVIEKEGSFFEKIVYLDRLLRDQLRDLAGDEEALKERLKTRGRQIMTQVLGLGSTTLRISMPTMGDIRTLPPEFLHFLPSRLLPEEFRPPASGSYTRRKPATVSPVSPFRSPQSGSPNSGLGFSTQLKQTRGYHREENRLHGEDVRALFKTKPFIGTFCDPIGFSQHKGECATDSLLQILMFADHWKAITQPFLYNMTEEQFLARLSAISERVPLRIRQKAFKDIIKNMQMRFRLHYAMIGTVKNSLTAAECIVPFAYRTHVNDLFTTDESVTGVLVRRKRRLSANLGTGLHTSLNNLTGDNWKGDTVDLVFFQLLLPFLGVEQYTPILRKPHTAISNYTDIKPHYSHVAFWLGSSVVDPVTITIQRMKYGHATAIYMCDGKWVYFDNNMGIMEMPLELMDAILNEVEPFNIYWKYVENTIEFYKMNVETTTEKERRLEREKGGDTAGRPLFIWGKDRRWKEYNGYNFNSLSSDLFVFNTIIHIVTANRSVPTFPGRHFIDDQKAVGSVAAVVPAPAPEPVPVNSLASTRKAFQNALVNAVNRGQKRVNNTTRRLQNRMKNLGLDRQKNVNNTTRALEKRILELASGSATRNR
jgi:hypothetical protein